MSWFNSCSLGSLSLVLVFAFGGNVWAQETNAAWVASKGQLQTVQASDADKSGSLESEVQALVTKLVKGMHLSKDGSLTRVAVLPFETVSRTEEERHLGQVSAALLSSRLGRQPSIIQVERTRLDAVLLEIEKSNSGIVNPKGAISVGKLLGASNVVLGRIAPSGADYLLTARVVDSETGQIVAIADHSFPRIGLVALSEDVVEVKTQSGAAIRSAVLPGWGQFYNDEVTKGIVYTTTFVGFLTFAATNTFIASQHAERYQQNQPNSVKYREMANEQYANVNRALFLSAGVWLLAVVDAYWHGRDGTSIDMDKFER